MKKLSDEEFVKKAKQFIDPQIIEAKKLKDIELFHYILLYRDRISKFGELNDLMRDFVIAPDLESVTVLNDYLIPDKDPSIYNSDMLFPKELKNDREAVQKYLKESKKIIEVGNWKNFFKKDENNELWIYAGKEGRGKVLLPVRVALSGRDKSVDIFEIMKAIGYEATLRRIENALRRLHIKDKELKTEARNEAPTASNTFTFGS